MFSVRSEKFRFAEFPRPGQCRYQERIQFSAFSPKLLYIYHTEVISAFSLMELTEVNRRENGLDARAYNYKIASLITQKNHFFVFGKKNCSKLARALYQSRSNEQRLELVLSLFENGLDNYYLI